MPCARSTRFLRVLGITFFLGGSGGFAANSAATPSPAAIDLANHFALLKNEQTLSARFICEKQLAALDTPLVSEGHLWIQKASTTPGKAAEEAVRFSTEKPYVSELILTGGKVLARSQHETEWTITNQSTRPGLTAVMTQLGAWSTGNSGKLNEMYAVTAGDSKIPNPPEGVTPSVDSAKIGVDTFILTPMNPDLLVAIKQLSLSLNRQDGTLLFLEIQTQQGDVTRYWFLDAKRNVPFPPNVFKPGSESLIPAEPKP